MLIALAVLLAACLLGAPDHALAGQAPAPQPAYDWGVAYYMPYDNNLEPFATRICDALRRGVTDGRTVAAVQKDLGDRRGMRRLTIRRGGIREEVVQSEDSASEEEAVAYLRWFIASFPCRRYAVVFLDHGGRLDEMCRDDSPGPEGKKWMSGRVLGEKLRALKVEMPGRWELLFLQQCGRGSMENLYSFRGTAEYVMASPFAVGAPNTYYTPTHRWLAANPGADGLALARQIARADVHYTAYACVRGRALYELPARLDGVLDPILARADLAVPSLSDPLRVAYGERYADTARYMRRVAAGDGAAGDVVDSFLGWARSRLIAGLWVRPGSGLARDACCGISLFVPTRAGDAEKYHDVDLYRQCRLQELWRKLLTHR